MGSMSRILVIGATGYIGRHIVKASLHVGHPTFLLVRPSTASNSEKAQLLASFAAAGANIVHGSMEDYASLVEAVKNVDVIISAIGSLAIQSQVNIINAIKEAGTVKRFLPSEFANDVDNVHAVEPARTLFEGKAKIRRAIEAEGIPYTYVCSNCSVGYFFEALAKTGLGVPPGDKDVIIGDGNARASLRDKVVLLGDGNARVAYVKEEDIGIFTIKAVDDPRTLNKTLYLRIPDNTLSLNDVVALWEKKNDETLEKIYVPEEMLLEVIAETPFPGNLSLAVDHSIFVKGDQTNFEIGPGGVEASQLYPDVNYTTFILKLA